MYSRRTADSCGAHLHLMWELRYRCQKSRWLPFCALSLEYLFPCRAVWIVELTIFPILCVGIRILYFVWQGALSFKKLAASVNSLYAAVITSITASTFKRAGQLTLALTCGGLIKVCSALAIFPVVAASVQTSPCPRISFCWSVPTLIATRMNFGTLWFSSSGGSAACGHDMTFVSSRIYNKSSRFLYFCVSPSIRLPTFYTRHATVFRRQDKNNSLIGASKLIQQYNQHNAQRTRNIKSVCRVCSKSVCFSGVRYRSVARPALVQVSRIGSSPPLPRDGIRVRFQVNEIGHICKSTEKLKPVTRVHSLILGY